MSVTLDCDESYGLDEEVLESVVVVYVPTRVPCTAADLRVEDAKLNAHAAR